jgi:hypothetical protein
MKHEYVAWALKKKNRQLETRVLGSIIRLFQTRDHARSWYGAGAKPVKVKVTVEEV